MKFSVQKGRCPPLCLFVEISDDLLFGNILLGSEAFILGVLNSMAFDTAVLPSDDRLQDFNTLDLDDGATASVASLQAIFTFDRTSTLAADDITIIQPAIGPGRWLRVLVGSIRWANQATWFIDPTNGNDENLGDTAGSPLRTLDELSRRLIAQTITSSMLVTLASGNNGNLSLEVNIPSSAVIITIQGTLSSTAPSAIDAVTASNPATNTRGLITDAATAFTDRTLLRLTSGASAGARAWVTRVPAAGSANVTHWALVNPAATIDPTLVEPVAGDEFVVDSRLSTVGGLNIRVQGPGIILFRELVVASSGSVLQLKSGNNSFAGVRFYACKILTQAFIQDSDSAFISCGLDAIFMERASIKYRACSLQNGLTCRRGGYASIQRGSCFDAFGMIVEYGAVVDFVGGAGVTDCCSWVDSTFAAAIDLNPGSFIEMDIGGPRLWGADNAFVNAAIIVRGGSTMVYVGTPPSIPGGPVDCEIGGVATAYGALPSANAARLCGIVDRP